MRRPNKEIIWISLIFIAVFAIRLYFALSYENLDYDSYFATRQIESIKERGLPIFNDNLSYSGNLLLFSPVFYYLIAVFSLVLKTVLAGKIIQNLLLAAIIPVTYLITKKITKNFQASIFSSLLVSFIPILGSTVASLEPFSLALPLMLLSVYYLISIEQKNNIFYFLIFAALSSIVSPISIILVPTFWIYLLLLRAERKKSKSAFEAILFTTFLILLVQFLIYKKAILMHGLSVIWQNIPEKVLSKYFSELDIIKTIANIGLLPFIFGLYGVYKSSFAERRSSVGALVALALFIGLMLWLNLIPVKSGLIFIAVTLSIISGSSFSFLFSYLKKTHFNKLKVIFMAVIAALFILSSVIPTFSQSSKIDTVTNSQIKAAIWLKENTVENVRVVSTLDEGYLITAIAQRKNILDKNFLLKSDAAQRYEDVNRIFTTNYETEALELLNRYRAKYIFLSKKAQNEFDVTEVRYFDEKCFKLLYDEEVKIYKTWCDLD